MEYLQTSCCAILSCDGTCSDLDEGFFFLNKVAWSHIACNRKTSFGVLRFDEANIPVVSGLLFFELLGNRRCLAMEWM